jgi:membrane protease YdiL (CAAX protease family)
MNRKSLSIPAAFSLFLFIILIEIGGSFIFNRFFSQYGNLSGLWFTCLLRFLDFGLIVLFVYISKKGPGALGFIPENWRKGICLGLLWSLGFGVVVFSLWGIALFFQINLLRFVISPSAHLSSAHFILLTLIGGILAPIVEDSFFIGCLYNSLRQKIPPLFSALGTSFFFALLHGLKGPPINQFIGGLIFAFAFEYSANLLTPITIHILGNCTLFTLNYSSLIKTFFLRW